jgi:hypothetical protein
MVFDVNPALFLPQLKAMCIAAVDENLTRQFNRSAIALAQERACAANRSVGSVEIAFVVDHQLYPI